MAKDAITRVGRMDIRGTNDIARGDRMMIRGVLYVVSHVKTDGKRGDINLIAYEEIRSRRDSLTELLEDN